MALRGIPIPPQMRRLCELLQIDHVQARGILNLLWYHGDLSGLSHAEIAQGIVDWELDPDRLIAALIRCDWLFYDDQGRLLCRDHWNDAEAHAAFFRFLEDHDEEVL